MAELMRDFSNLAEIQVLITNDSFGPVELSYYPIGRGSHWFTKHYPYDPPPEGYKIHICPLEHDALRVAREVLPVLLRWVVPHKVVRSLERYREINAGDQRGKFITIYTGGASLAQLILSELDPRLVRLRLSGCIRPTSRESNHAEAEIAVGQSGVIATRWSKGED